MSELRLNRKKSRKFLFQELYSSCFVKFNEELFLESFFEWVFDFISDIDYINDMKKNILKNEFYLVWIIKMYAPKFSVESMNLTYILPIYISLTEMFFIEEEIPAVVSINEAVDLAKIYWDESSKKIVNWILHKVSQNIDDTKKYIETTEKWNYNSIFK